MVYIFTKGNGTINKVYKPATDEIFIYDKDEYIKVLENDITSLIGKINNIKNFNEFDKWRNGGIKKNRIDNFKVTAKNLNCANDEYYCILNKYNKGRVVKSIVSIFNSVKNSHSQIHPTEKPVKLMEILIELIDKQQDNFTILDPFAGSCSQAIACYNLNKNFIGCEIDKEYYNLAVNRIYKECPQKLF
jgi:site-specific DNA-methyltransferase (adenine-specific)